MKQHSSTEEDYLKVIYKFSAEGASVATNTISRHLKTSPASVTDMVKRLGEKGLVDYQPYKGVRLTEAGQRVALKTVRKHRLWEVFLVNVLHFSWDNVHETAEQLEHIDSPELIQKLDEFLGYPKFDPHGDPIPSATGEIVERETIPLAECPADSRVTVAGVTEHSKEFLRYLDRIGLNIGTVVEVLERIEFDQSLMLNVKGREIVLSGGFARQVLVIDS